MTPWRRRLNDLRQLIIQADQHYFDPDLFRLNINSAIQTARTVTFIVQKQKPSISDFDQWYEPHQNALKADAVMLWLVDARNRIEKQGDLETYSECYAEVIYSYTHRGSRVNLKDNRLLFCGVKKLIRHVLRDFPTGVAKAASILIERRWVATSFPTMELTDVLEYAFSKLHELVSALDVHLGDGPETAPRLRPSPVGSATRRSYVKILDQKRYSMSSDVYSASVSDIRAAVARAGYDIESLRAAFARGLTLSDRARQFAKLASDLFDRDGYHISLFVYLDAGGNIMRNMQVRFDDQADKLNFWHSRAREAEADPSFCGLLFISEFWDRRLEDYPARPISEAPIVGEGLKILAADQSGSVIVHNFMIEQLPDGKRVRQPGEIETSAHENVLVPILGVWQARRQSDAARATS
jgi:hypothetical protein